MTINQHIHGSNELKRIAKIEIENVLKQLPKYLNKKIFTVDGSKTKAFSIEFVKAEPAPFKPEFKGQTSNATNQGAYLSDKYNALRLHISICIGVKEKPGAEYHGARYFRWDYDLGKMSEQDGKLIELYSIEQIIKTHGLNNYLDEQEENRKIELYSKKLKELQDIRNTVKIDSNFLPKYV